MAYDTPPPLPASERSRYASGDWDVERVTRAIQCLDAGSFYEAARLREVVRRDARARGAECQLRNLFCALDIEIEGGESAHGNAPAEAMRRAAEGLYGENGRAASPATIGSTVEDVAGFGVAFAWLHFEAEGGRWTPRLTPWCIDAVEADRTKPDTYMALLEGGQRMPIEGENWIIFREAGSLSHRRGALRAIGLDWIAAAFTAGDWATRSGTTGPRDIGMLPPGIKAESPEGRRIATDLAGLARGYSGMVHEFVEGGGQAIYRLASQRDEHAIHKDLLERIASNYAIAMLGTDGLSALGSTGTYGARQTLYGVAYDYLLGLARIITAGLCTVSDRWALLNFGRVYGPRVEVEVPDLEEQLAISEEARRRPGMIAELQALAARGPIPEEVVFEIAARYGTKVSQIYASLWALAAPTSAPSENSA